MRRLFNTEVWDAVDPSKFRAGEDDLGYFCAPTNDYDPEYGQVWRKLKWYKLSHVLRYLSTWYTGEFVMIERFNR